MEFSLQQLGYRLIVFLAIVCLNGLVLALLVDGLGDKGPRQDGRLSPSPLVHVDLIGALCAVLFGPGWIKPFDVDAAHLRGGRVGQACLPLFGSAIVLVTVAALQVLLPRILPMLGDSASQVAFALVRIFGELGLWFAVLNLLPLPVLAGEHFIAALRPDWSAGIRRLRLPAAILLFGLGALGAYAKLLGGIVRSASEVLLR